MATKQGKFYMGGTENTGEYVVVAITSLGRVGIRPLEGKTYRVRIEPKSDKAATVIGFNLESNDWNPPENGQLRYSRTGESVKESNEAMKEALRSIGAAYIKPDKKVEKVVLGEGVPKWIVKFCTGK